MARKKIKHLVFDMGGVLIEINWHHQVSKLLGKDIPFEEIHALWANSKATTDFEHGRIGYEAFVSGFIAEHDVKVPPEEFKQEFMSIVVGDFPGVEKLLAELKPKFTLSLLSNTNVMHWQHVQKISRIFNYIENPFTSIYFGVMKPDPDIYQKMIFELDCYPEEILFFDDGKMNIDSAREFGLHAEQVFGPDDIRRVLKDYQLL